jgi:imidazolonepropionase-like amidohydrolase
MILITNSAARASSVLTGAVSAATAAPNLAAVRPQASGLKPLPQWAPRQGAVVGAVSAATVAPNLAAVRPQASGLKPLPPWAPRQGAVVGAASTATVAPNLAAVRPQASGHKPLLHASTWRVAAALALAALFAAPAPRAHDTVPAPPQSEPIVIAGGTVYPVSAEPIPEGRVRFENGRIVAVGGSEVATAGARVIDAAGKHVYPGLIASTSVLGLTEVSAVRALVDEAEVGANAANVRAEQAVNADSEHIPVTRSGGVLLALTVPQPGNDGVIAGRSALLALEGWTFEELTVQAPVGLHVYWPSSRLPSWAPPAMAEGLRKATADKLAALTTAFEQARAYAAASPLPVPDPRLEAMRDYVSGQGRVFFHADEAGSILEALAFAREHGLKAVLVGGLEAWRVADQLRAGQVPVIIAGIHRLPLRRNDPVEAPFFNPARLAAAGVDFAIATEGGAFATANLRNLPNHAATAVAHGLAPAQALAAITLAPARILGVEDRYGSLEAGKEATVFIVDRDILDTRARVLQAWIGGREIDLANRHTRLYEKYRQKYPETR